MARAPGTIFLFCSVLSAEIKWVTGPNVQGFICWRLIRETKAVSPPWLGLEPCQCFHGITLPGPRFRVVTDGGHAGRVPHIFLASHVQRAADQTCLVWYVFTAPSSRHMLGSQWLS